MSDFSEARIRYLKYRHESDTAECGICGQECETRRNLYGAVVAYRFLCDCSEPDTTRKVARLHMRDDNA
jgi:transcription elongation factor Elf1